MATVNTNLSNYDKSALPNAKDFKIGIVVSEWNSDVTNGLLDGALQTLSDCGVTQQTETPSCVAASLIASARSS